MYKEKVSHAQGTWDLSLTDRWAPCQWDKGHTRLAHTNFCVYKTPKSGVVAHLLEIMVFPAVQHSLNWMDLSPIPLAENDIVPINIIFNIMSWIFGFSGFRLFISVSILLIAEGLCTPRISWDKVLDAWFQSKKKKILLVFWVSWHIVNRDFGFSV